jgi:CRISPR/Cas system-associated exonuclease Cas4 (RecB family)
MRVVRASEISEYDFCSLKWYYRIKGIKISKEREIEKMSAFKRGEEIHKKIGENIVKTHRITSALKYLIIFLLILLLVALWISGIFTYLLQL